MVGIAGVQLCEQSQLDRLHPEKNWTCKKDPDQLAKILSSSEVHLLYANSFFNSTDFSSNPIKTKVVAKLHSFTGT
jgi:hypothetical protein